MDSVMDAGRRATPDTRVMEDSPPIGIAGSGRVARAIGRLLYLLGAPVAAAGSRNPEHARGAATFAGDGVRAVTLAELPAHAGRILVAVADDAVEEVACTLAEAGMQNGAVLHTCGALGAEALAPLAAQGVSCGALHPLQTFATPEQGVSSLPGAAFALTADGAAAEWGEDIAKLLGAKVLRIPADRRTIYHAAAVMGSNYVVALIDAAVLLLLAAGVEEADARAALAPLARTSVENAIGLGAARALTGPIERNDLRTVAG
ncbi:MAG: Rossmann-like and DUF2520 domain-containing protein, partial [Bryobacteraceae bacterium]